MDPAKDNVDTIENMLLGSSIATKFGSSAASNKVIACSFLRINEYQAETSYYPNGACNFIKPNGNSKYDQMIEPFKSRSSQTVGKEYHYSHSIFGFSSLFIKENGLLVIGAPGFYTWRGAIVLYTPGSSYSFPLIRHLPLAQASSDSYFGYAIASGRLFQSRHIYIASSAPREGDTGAVYYFRVETLLASEQLTSIYGYQVLRGQEIGEYFGYSILIADINGDLMDDLIVGAPLYSPDISRRGDIGRVYIYQSNDVHFLNPTFLYGDRTPKSRFGSTLAELGDINFDGYKDIVIGAPYEDDDCGSIYIYHGSKVGLSGLYSQKISCSDFPSYNLKGFGFSIAAGVDIDGNKYPDLVIGAPFSDKAIVLRSQPIGALKVSLQPDTVSVDESCRYKQNLPCFNITYCMILRGQYLNGLHTVEVKIDIDTLLGSDGSMSRGQFIVNNEKLKSFRKETLIESDKRFCEKPIQVMIKKDIRDKLTPLEFTLNYQLLNRLPQFCSNCPHLIDTSTISETIPFETGCGDDGVCVSDVTMSLFLTNKTSKLGSLIEGFHSSVYLIIALNNAGENAHAAKITLTVEPPLKTSFESITFYETNDTSLTLNLDVGNPLGPGSKELQILFDLRSSLIEHSKINFFSVFTTKSDYAGGEPIKSSLTIGVERFAHLDIIGHESMPVFFDHPDTRSKHYERFVLIFTIFKTDYSSIRSPVVVFHLPASLPNEPNFIFKPKIESLDSTTITCELSKSGLEQMPVEDSSNGMVMSEALRSSEEISISREKRSINESINLSTDPVTKLDCSTTSCKDIECRLGSFGPGSKSVNIRLIVVVNLQKLQKSFGSHIGVFNYTAEAKTAFLDSMVTGNGKWSQSALSEVQLNQLPYKEAASFWIIAGCSFAGLFLFLLIIIALVKVGFFQRKTRQQTEVLKQRYSMAITPNMLKELEINLNEDDSEEENGDSTEPFPKSRLSFIS
ncbi:integrin alpha-9 isoform X2 [Tetranychus urticae]|nr:integrin alpha-9 isoform X2 [Tetranychus urticae]